MRTLFRLVCFMIPFCIIISCRTIKTVAPAESYGTPEFEYKSSTIGVPVEIDIKDLENRINKELKGTIYEDDSYENNNLKVKAIKKDNFTISLKGNELSYRIPLRLQIQVKKLFIEFPEVTAELALQFKTTFSINKDWTLNTKTVSNGYEWLSTPVISVGGFDMSIKYLADVILTAGKDKITKEIDKAVKSNINLKDYIADAWKLLQKPIKVSDEYNAWLKITPSEISATQVTGKNDKVNLGVEIKSINELYVGSEPAAGKPVNLPDLIFISSLDPKFSINLNADVQITKINELAEKELTGQVFKEGKKQIEIKSIKLYGCDNYFAVEVGLQGSIKGKVYLKGRPEYNPANRSVEIKDLNFDINTKNALVKSASWLLHSQLIKVIEPKLVYSIAGQIDDIKKQIQDNLKDNRSIKGILLKGDLKKIDIDNIFITPQSVKVGVILEGTLQVIVENLSGM